MNDQHHWDKIGTSYQEEIFDVYQNDTASVVSHLLDQYKNKQHTAIDFGCGIGKALPFLSTRFQQVLAVDISPQLLRQARTLALDNVIFKKADLTHKALRLPVADFIFCCNVALFADKNKNHMLFSNIYKKLKPNGIAMIIVPSLESALFSSWRLLDWYGQEGVAPNEVDEDLSIGENQVDLIEGLIPINGTTTKHYLAEELSVILRRCEFDILSMEKVQYAWNTEFHTPPQWMKAPYPWDWVVVVKKHA